MTKESNEAIPEPCMQPVCEMRRRLSIGLPKCDVKGERRVALTPEGASLLIERGLTVKIERGAGESIHYPDGRYARFGAEIVERSEALACNIVVSPAPLTAGDVKHMARGSVLMTLLHLDMLSAEMLGQLLSRNITSIALDLVEDTAGQTPFADILAEVDGRASVALGSSMLADGGMGKGILLGGVSGVVPCEVAVIGSGIAGLAAAKSAAGMGATVRLFDNDVYRLRRAEPIVGVVGSALHPRVFHNALRTADMLVVTPTQPAVEICRETLLTMKRGVVLMDLTGADGGAFPSLPVVDCGEPDPGLPETVRRVYVNPGGAVRRTTAMALSNTLVTLFDSLLVCDGISNALRINTGLRKAVYTFLGHVVNPQVARVGGMRQIDINLYLALS